MSERFDNDSNLTVMQVNQYEQVIKMLMHDRVDAMAASTFVLHYLLNKVNGLDKVDFKKKLNLGYKEQWLQMSKKSNHKDKIPALNQITERYYGPQWKVINQ